MTISLPDHLRLGRPHPDDFSAAAERRGAPELYVHLHQLCRVVRQQRPQLRPRAQAARRQRGRVQRDEEQAVGGHGRLQGNKHVA